MDLYKTFLKKFAIAAALILLFVLATNAYIDPLWYFGGNRFSEVNYAFNERESKLNLYLQSPASYDCILFGSSGATILDADLIKGHHCFNFSFKGARVGEYVDYAKYIRHLGFVPTFILVDVDLYNLQSDKLKDHAPDYVKTLAPPPSVISAYLSLDVFVFSLETIFGSYKNVHAYDKNFKGVTLPLDNGALFDWRKQLGFVLTLYYSPSDPITSDNVKYFKDLRDIFPEATYVGFMPYRSVLLTERIKAVGNLEPSLRATFELSKIFDRFYDFTVPSPITIDASDTADGFHFGINSAQQMAVEINNDNKNNLFNVKDKTFDAYEKDYNLKLDEVGNSQNIEGLTK